MRHASVHHCCVKVEADAVLRVAPVGLGGASLSPSSCIRLVFSLSPCVCVCATGVCVFAHSRLVTGSRTVAARWAGVCISRTQYRARLASNGEGGAIFPFPFSWAVQKGFLYPLCITALPLSVWSGERGKCPSIFIKWRGFSSAMRTVGASSRVQFYALLLYLFFGYFLAFLLFF